MKKGRGWIWAYAVTLIGTLLLVHWGSQTVTVIAEIIPVPRAHCIVLDPGHGGMDGGATSCTGQLESRYNLEIALKLRDLLHFMGYPTRMIRTTDESVSTEGDTIARQKASDLRNRVKIVNETEGAVLVSIHQNQFPDSRYRGAQVFYAETAGSSELARKLQHALIQNLNPGSRRREKQSSGVYLMEHIERPGVLIECGFLSNPGEEALLCSPEYQRKLCCVIASALQEFLG